MKEKMEQRAERLNDILGKEHSPFRVVYQKTMKGEGYELRNQTCISPLMYLDDWWEKDDQEICKIFEKFYEKFMSGSMVNEYLQQFSILDRTFVKDHVLPRLIPLDKKEALEQNNTVSVPYQDLLISFVVELNKKMDVQVTYAFCEYFMISVEELYQWSVENLDRTYCLESMSDVMKELGAPSVTEILKEQNIPVQVELWILSNFTRRYGAACILSKTIMKKVAEKLGDNLVILPSSVHEVLVFTHTSMTDLPFLLQSVKEINQTLQPGEFLSDNIYLYVNGEIKSYV